MTQDTTPIDTIEDHTEVPAPEPVQEPTPDTAPVPETTKNSSIPLPLPPHYAWPSPLFVDYQQRALDAYNWRELHSIQLVSNPGLCVIPIDLTAGLISPGSGGWTNGPWLVPGALEAARRGVEWGYRWMHHITMWAPAAPAHTPHQVFNSASLVDENGKHPAPGTAITTEDIDLGRWQVSINAVRALFPNVGDDKIGDALTFMRQYLRWYGVSLPDQGFIVRPYYGIVGGLEQSLLPALHELIFFSEITRGFDRRVQFYDMHKMSESLDPQGPSVATDYLGRSIFSGTPFIDLTQYKYIVTFGSPSSHRFKWFMDRLVKDYRSKDPEAMKRVYILKGCTAPAEGMEKIAEEAFASYAAEGINIIEDEMMPLTEWPGMEL